MSVIHSNTGGSLNDTFLGIFATRISVLSFSSGVGFASGVGSFHSGLFLSGVEFWQPIYFIQDILYD